jgi:hypothetical protein
MRILLLGAGFTRNWGSWLASEFVGELCGRLIDRPHLTEMLRTSGNFEAVYGVRRSTAEREADNLQANEDVVLLQAAITSTFREINISLANRHLNFCSEARCTTKRFLSRFDAIFTLNQDLFFELHYDSMSLESDGRWDGHCWPGVRNTHEWLNAHPKRNRVDMTRTIAESSEAPHPRSQPIYKNRRRASLTAAIVVSRKSASVGCECR